jgi:hypothetical protein
VGLHSDSPEALPVFQNVRRIVQENRNMRTKGIITGIIIAASFVANVFFIYERLASQFYQRGRLEGVNFVSQKLVEEVQTKGRISVKMPNGKVATLIAPTKSAPPTVPPLDTHPVIKSKVEAQEK